ncbi:hypothetical protein [Actinoplanes sp. NPDC051851]|uniref:hypothetical protein n=1 Tax=Actinoplanes sp. NPDC051851 TaxID=3154753 RepID=UPI00342DAE76
MRRLTRARTRTRAALICVLVLLAGQLVAATPARAANAGDLATVAGGPGANAKSATAIAMGARGLALNAAGTVLYVADIFANVVRSITLSTGLTSVIAGMGANNSNGDGGAATSAGINTPADLAVDAAGDLWIAAQLNNKIRKVTMSTGIMSSPISSGLNNPQGVAFNSSGDGFIADTYNGKVLKYSGGTVTTFASGLNRPSNIAFDSAGNVYVTDCQNHVVYRWTSAGASKTVVAGNSTLISGTAVDGVLATASGLNCPRGIVIDSSDVVYISDSANNRIRRFTVGGTISTIAGTGTAGMGGDGGAATSATLDHPTDLVEDASTGRFYVSQGGDQISDAGAKDWGVRSFIPGGNISTVGGNGWWGQSGDGGPATDAQLYRPGGVAFDSSNGLYIADTGNNLVRTVSAGVITTFAGTGLTGGTTATDGGAATSGNLSTPQDVAVDSGGAVYIADTGHHRIRRVSGGVIGTVAGTGTSGSTTTGVAATTLLSSPWGVSVTASGRIYIADTGNNRILMMNGTAISVVAGTGTSGYSGDGGAPTGAKLNGPRDVKVDEHSGDVYIADTGNHVVRRIRNGVITTVAGTGSSPLSDAGDGGLATAAVLDSPDGLETDADGNLYIADGDSTAAPYGGSVIRRVDKHGVIHHLAGKYNSYSWAGDGSAAAATSARIHTPGRMAFDSSGTLYFPNAGELRVRSIAVETGGAYFWVSDATAGATGVIYGWEFVARTGATIGSVTITVPAAASGSGLYLVSAVHLPKTGTVTLSGSTLTYTLSSPVTVPAGRHMYLSVAGFTNTASSNFYYSTITSRTSGGGGIDVSSSGAVYFSTASAVLVLPNPDATVTAPAQQVIYVDPFLRADTTLVSAVNVHTDATRGYSLTIAGTALTGTAGTLSAVSSGLASPASSFTAGHFGYTVGVSGAGSFAGTAGAYAGYTSAGETAVTATKPTTVGGDTVSVTNRLKVDHLQKAGVYTGTVTYRVTGSY